MPALSRRVILSAFAALAMAACGNANGSDGDARQTRGDALPDMVLGDPDAPVELIEYASVTCGACAQFHIEVLPTIKADYIDTGKAKLVFREFPTPPANVAIAGFALARCAGEDQYFDVIDDMFQAQPGILMAARQGAVGPALQTIGERYGIQGEDAFQACLTDRQIREDIADVVMSGEELQVSSTPTLFLQGRRLENNLTSRTVEGLSGLIDTELEALGLATPAAAEVPAESDAPEATAETPAEN